MAHVLRHRDECRQERRLCLAGLVAGRDIREEMDKKRAAARAQFEALGVMAPPLLLCKICTLLALRGFCCCIAVWLCLKVTSNVSCSVIDAAEQLDRRDVLFEPLQSALSEGQISKTRPKAGCPCTIIHETSCIVVCCLTCAQAMHLALGDLGPSIETIRAAGSLL